MKRLMLLAGLVTAAALIEGIGLDILAQNPSPAQSSFSTVVPTKHPALPGHQSLYWVVPDSTARSATGAAQTAAGRFAKGVSLIEAGDYAGGLSLLKGADVSGSALGPYVLYYTGRALLGLSRPEEAMAALKQVDEEVDGYLEQLVPMSMAEAAIGLGDPEEAVDLLDDLSDETVRAPEEILLRLAAAYEAAGDTRDALEAYQRVYYQHPLSDQAIDAQSAIERLETAALIPLNRFDLELGRAERLFSARRWAQSRAAFESLDAAATRGDHRELIDLRLAECDHFLGRHRPARDALRPYLESASREAEARFFHLSATRGLGDHATYVTLARDLVADHPDSSWAEETLNNLASHYLTGDDEAAADGVFRELARRFPRGRYADRAAWKIGWLSYKQERYAETAQVFESAAAAFPRNDYRPSWLYWAARSQDQLGDRNAANALYRIVATDYLNSYYGRLAAPILSGRREAPVRATVIADAPPAVPAPLVPNDAVIRALLSVSLYEQALEEVEYARTVWGDSSALQATVGWIRNKRGLEPGADDRFADVRGAITITRRAYPQFMAAGGEQLPPELLRVIFPLDYWPLIKKYSDAHGLDPYLMTALVAQESTFTPDVRSSANAVGLMQLIPGTARRYAQKLGIRYSARILTTPETNVRMGMRYFKDLVDRFGGAHYALASYNAGEHRIQRWIAERPGFEQDEFIDDIPFPETQNYVKRILGTADDYRRLYGGGTANPATPRR